MNTETTLDPQRLPQLPIYKPNSRGTGGVSRFGLNPAKSALFVDAATQVGDKQFAADANAAFWQHKLQCFDFVDDPVTMLALYVAGYERCGTRNY